MLSVILNADDSNRKFIPSKSKPSVKPLKSICLYNPRMICDYRTPDTRCWVKDSWFIQRLSEWWELKGMYPRGVDPKSAISFSSNINSQEDRRIHLAEISRWMVRDKQTMSEYRKSSYRKKLRNWEWVRRDYTQYVIRFIEMRDRAKILNIPYRMSQKLCRCLKSVHYTALKRSGKRIKYK